MQNKLYIKKLLLKKGLQMQTKQKLEEENVKKFNFIKPEIDYILQNANFTVLEESVFKRLIDKNGRQSIVQISMNENISTSTTSRIIKQIKNKILRLL